MLRGIRLAAWPTSWRRRPARDQARSRRRICGAAILRSVPVVQQLMEYAQNERHGASISELLGTGIDQVLEADPDRRVFIFGYSLGNLVALDFLFPRASLHMPNDARLQKAVAGFISAGCPTDFVRLYVPRYLCDRTKRVDNLAWRNIFIAADVFASNFVEGNDLAVPSPCNTPGPDGCDVRPDVSIRYTDEKLTLLNVWGRKGFLSHRRAPRRPRRRRAG